MKYKIIELEQYGSLETFDGEIIKVLRTYQEDDRPIWHFECLVKIKEELELL